MHPSQNLRRALTKIAHGAMSIVGIQAINFLVPLLALPMISRALGVAQFGKYAILLSYGLGLIIFVDFSFHVIGPLRLRKAIAEGRILALLFESACLKLILAIPASMVFVIVVIRVVDVDLPTVIAALVSMLSVTFTPRWAVYGMGKLFPFAIISAISKFSWLGAVIWFVRTPDDLFRLMLISVLTQFIALILSFFIVWPNDEAKRIEAGWMRRVIVMFRQDGNQFAALLANSSFRELGIVILSATASLTAVSSFALADRVRMMMIGVVQPVTQALFLFTIGAESGNSYNDRARRIANFAVLLAATCGGIFVYVFAGTIIMVLGGKDFAGAVPILRILTLIPIIGALSSILGPNTLLAAGAEKSFAACQFAAALSGFPLTVGLCYWFGAIGAAWATVLSETTLMCFFMYELRRHNLMGQVFGMSPKHPILKRRCEEGGLDMENVYD